MASWYGSGNLKSSPPSPFLLRGVAYMVRRLANCLPSEERGGGEEAGGVGAICGLSCDDLATNHGDDDDDVT